MIDTQAIRSKMLYFALRGQLTNQNPLEDSGSSLIENNNRIISAYSDDIKKRVGKGCKPIKPEDCLFEVPKTWCWERFGNLVINFDSLRRPVTKSDRKRLLGQYDYYGATGAIDRVDDYIFDGEYLMIGEDGGNFFVSRDNSFIARGRFWANNHVHVVQPIICDIVYLKRCLDAYDLPKMGLVYGIGAPKLNQENMNSIPIPVPPLAEQQRIVARIEQAFSVLDTIDTLQAQYADNLTVLKSKLIDASIQGKLTEQLPEDGTAEELYQHIQSEKQSLIKAGKIKKEKPLPEILDDDVPFTIPSNWKWVRTGDIFSVGTGMTPLTSEKRFYENGRIPWVTSSLTSNRYIKDTTTYLSEYALEATSLRLHPEHTLVIAMYGEGKTRGQISELLIPATTNQACATLDNIVYNQATVDYIFFFFTHNYVQLRSQAGGSNQPNLNLNKIKETLIPLPPLAEQKRIVERITELLAVCGELK